MNQAADDFLANIRALRQKQEDGDGNKRKGGVKKVEEKFDKIVDKTGRGLKKGAKIIQKTTKNQIGKVKARRKRAASPVERASQSLGEADGGNK